MMYRYCVYYFYEDGGKDTTCAYLPYLKGIIFRRPSESIMFIPGTHQQMLEDYE